MGMTTGDQKREAGVIPSDWGVLPFDAIFRKAAVKNHQVQARDYQESGAYPVVDQGQTPIVGYSDRSDRVFRVPEGGVVVFGDHTCLVKLVKHDFLVGADGTQVLLARAGQDVAFHAYALVHRGVPTTGYNRHFKFLKERSFQAPPLPEQRAIAAALSDVDALLVSLAHLIAKKRNLKQAAMQQLLTGRTRLPGFSGEWTTKRLGDHLTFLRNGVNTRAELQDEGPVKYLHYGDVHAIQGVFVSPESLPAVPAAKAVSLDRLRDGDLIFVDASEDIDGVGKSVELVNAGSIEMVSGLHTIAARFDKRVLADGFKGFLQFCPTFAAHLRRLAAGTKVYATARSHVAGVEMRLPEVAEQQAIALVLSDMDAELAALKVRRDKIRDLKQAMMQELLSGRTRLV